MNDWTCLFREACSHSIANLLPLQVTAHNPVQIDESYFRSRRKYNREECYKEILSQTMNRKVMLAISEVPGYYVSLRSNHVINLL